MKTRVLSLLLALVLLVSVLTVSASAASAKDVHTYLKNLAMEGQYNADAHWYENGFVLDSDNGVFYGVYYLEQTGYIECSMVTNNFEVTWRISSNPSPAYTAFIRVYDDSHTTGNVSIGAGYNGSNYGSFSSFSGDTSLKATMLQVLNSWLPMLVEITRAVINENDYSLADLGITGYKACSYWHAYDHGRVTQQPTCVAEGVMTYTCRVCGTARTESIEATGNHIWDAGRVLVEPGCTTEGVYRYTCTVCGTNTMDVSLPALGHAWSLTEAEGSFHDAAQYTCTRCGETKDGRLCAGEVFTDMPGEDHWAHNAIDWAYFGGITSGTTPNTFSPEMTITRSQAVTFLWAAADKPEPESTENPFTDVTNSDYFYKPVLWARENGVTSGTGPNTFGPYEVCTRSQIVTFLWAAAGKPEPESTENPFQDVLETDYFYKAVLWARENGITSGTATDTFGSYDVCTRAQVVTFLYKASMVPAG